jgi:inner membrane transporter RhtA
MSEKRGVLGAVLTLVTSGSSNQVGAALGAHAFPTIGPAGVVTVRQFVTALVLMPTTRPPLRRYTWSQWWPTLVLGAVFAVMNLSLYIAVDRIGLGLAVTLEFLGPLAVALLSSRTLLDAGCALTAGAAVVVLVDPGPTSDYLGVGFGLLAALGWALYILTNRLAGARLPGLQATAVASTVSTLVYLPILVVLLIDGRFTWAALGYSCCAGLLSSVLPYAVDLTMLRRLPTQFFGILMSINPVLAAFSGILLLHQLLTPRQWFAVALVVLANAVATTAIALRQTPVSSRSNLRTAAPLPQV